MKKYIIPLFVALILVACEDVIDVELNEADTDLYAIEAKITTTTQPFVFLTRGMPVTVDEDYQGISNAMVTLTDDASPANTVVLTEGPDRPGYYTVPSGKSYRGVAGREYTLRIETEEGVMLTASDILSPVAKIDSIIIRPSIRGEGHFLAIYTYGIETPGSGDYYKWDIFINDTLLGDANVLAFATDEFVDGNYVNGLEIFTDFHNPHAPEERRLCYLDTIYVQQNSISAFAYNYYSQLFSQSMNGGLFSVPPANIQSNFISSDGKEVLGLFTAHDVSTSNSVIIDDAIENQLVE